MQSLITYLEPWEFSPTLLISWIVAALLFGLGLRQRRREGLRTGFWRTLSFYLGLVMIYVVMQTYYDYLSQHMFWIHRLQHLVLHHLAPFLIVLAYPHEVMAYGIPQRWRSGVLIPLWRSLPVRICYRFLQNPVVAPLLFVGLIYFWLDPGIHFDAMLSETLYKLMNWSMLLDGLLFWWLIVDKRKPVPHRTFTYPIRILVLFVVMIAQILIGAYITLSDKILYSVYSVCGRAWPISPMTDQILGGVITWIPAAMMSVIGILLVIRLWMQQSSERHELVTRLAAGEQ
jgi:putative membrane protein